MTQELAQKGFTQKDQGYIKGLETQYKNLLEIQRSGGDIKAAREKVQEYKAMMIGKNLDPGSAQRIDQEARNIVLDAKTHTKFSEGVGYSRKPAGLE